MERPGLSSELSGTELLRWYWLKDELIDFARVLGVSTRGEKETLTGRIAAALDGRGYEEPEPGRATSGAAKQLDGELRGDTVIPAGQRCSQVLRAWFVAQLGTGFRFDAAMRSFLAEADGTSTLDDALAHWHASRDRGPKAIGGQFEYNRFTRAYYAEHPQSTAEEVRAAWWQYRSLPVDQRPQG